MFIATIFGVFLLLAAIGLPISLALVAGSAAPLLFFTTTDLQVIVQRFFNAVNQYSLMAIPLFVLSGALLDKGGVSKRLVRFANSLVGWMPGGLAIVAFVSSAFFGAISGSSLATVAAIGAIVVPSMVEEGYPLPFALSTVASAGWLGIIIPPSIPMVLYGISGNVSVGDLFLGGVLPGIILTVGMASYAFWFGLKHMKNRRKFSWKEVRDSLGDAIWALGMPIIILGGIYGGIFTPTESAAVACFYGVIIGFLVYRELTWKLLQQILRSSVVTTAFIMFVVASATAYGYVMTIEMIPTQVANFIISIASSKFMFLVLVTILLLIVGTFMDTAPAMMILSPILVPILPTYGISPVAFGIIMTINLGIGQVTPPVGMNLYVAASIKKVPVSTVINRHLWIYMLCAFILLCIFMAVPDIIMLLPNLLGQ